MVRCNPTTIYLCVLYRLQRLLRLSSLDDILDTCQVEAPNIIHNMTQVNKNGIVTNIDQPGMYTLLTLIYIYLQYILPNKFRSLSTHSQLSAHCWAKASSSSYLLFLLCAAPSSVMPATFIIALSILLIHSIHISMS